MASSDRAETAPAVRRLAVGTARFRDWFLLDLNRYALALAPLLVGFVVFSGLEVGGVIDFTRNPTPMYYLFSALATGNMTLTTIVITINQLILSRELRSPRELQTEMEAAAEYRENVEEGTGHVVVPEEPEQFLLLLVRDTRSKVTALADAAEQLDGAPPHADLAELVSNLEAELDGAIDRLERSRGGVFPALSTVLDADFATRINHTRWIRRSSAGSLQDSTRDLLGALEEQLEELDVARQYFKTIYIKQELAGVSKLVMSTGFVATVVAIVLIVFAGDRTSTLTSGLRLFLVPFAVTVNLVPLALLISHVFRIATVARRTAAITPFLAPAE